MTLKQEREATQARINAARSSKKHKRAPNDFKTAWRNMTTEQRVEAFKWIADKGNGFVQPGPGHICSLRSVRMARSFK